MKTGMKPPRFTVEEETALHARMIQGDQEAKELLAKSVLPWACKCALRYANGRIDEEEILGLAGFAIVKCFGRWEPARGRLTTAVAWSVRNVVEIHKKYMLPAVKIPAAAHAREQTKDFAEQAQKGTFSLSKIHEGKGVSFGELIEAASEGDTSNHKYECDLLEMRELFQSALRKIEDDRQIWILLRRADGLTLEQIGTELEITRERVRQIETQAINAVRKILGISA